MRKIQRKPVALLLVGTTVASSFFGMSMVSAAEPGAASQMVETSQTGHRVSATTIPVSLGGGLSATVDTGTGNLNTTMSVEGVSFAHNSLTPKSTGAGTMNAWRVSALGAGRIGMDGDKAVLVDATGQRVTFTPLAGKKGQFSSPAEQRYTLTRNGTGFALLSWDAQTTVFFNEDGQPFKATDRHGNTTTVDNADTLPTHISRWKGAAATKNTWVTRTGESLKIGLGADKEHLSRTWNLAGAQGSFTTLTDPRGKTTAVVYDGQGRITSVKDAAGAVTTIAYDGQGRVTSVTAPSGAGNRATRFAYPDATHTLTASAATDPGTPVAQGPHTTYVLNQEKRVTEATDADGRKQSATYTPRLGIASATTGTGEAASTSTYAYGANDGASLTQATAANGSSSSAEYQNQAANTQYAPSSSTDVRGNKTTYTYSAAGDVTKSTNALAATAELSYNPDGSVATATAPGNAGNPTRYEYNGDHLLTRVTPPTGGSVKPETYTYDGLGRVATKNTGKGGKIAYTYDGSSELVTSITATPAGAGSAETTQAFTYDAVGRPTQVVSSAKGAQVSKVTYGYDAAGNVKTKTTDQVAVGDQKAQKNTITYTYDAENRPASKSLDGYTTGYVYSAAGTLEKMTYPEGAQTRTVSFGTDDQGRRTDVWYGAGLQEKNQDYSVWKHTTYDGAGNVTRQTVKRAGAVSPTTDNPAGIQTLEDKQFCYIPNTNPQDCGADKGKAVDKIQAIYTTGSNGVAGYSTYYTYDAVGRLTGVDTPGSTDGKYLYTYDAQGNRVKAQHVNTGLPATTDENTFNAQNQTTSDGWGYDAEGNLTSSEKAAAEYNTVGQNTKTTLKDGSNTTTNVYSGVGQQELLGQDSTKNGAYQYAYGLDDRYGNPQMEKVTHEGRSAWVEHDPVTGDPLFLRDTDRESVHMYIADPVDSDLRVVKDDGGSSDYKEFDPFGARSETYSPRDRDKFDPFRYRFGLVDRGGTGRYLFGARHYDPTHGVWVEQDVLDSPLDPVNANRYVYAGADPINNIDPAGFLTFWQDVAVAGVGAAATAGATAIPGVGTAVAGAIGGCAGGALTSVFEGGDLEDAAEKCVTGAALGVAGGVVASVTKNLIGVLRSAAK